MVKIEQNTFSKNFISPDIPPTEIQFITYESVLLEPNRNMYSHSPVMHKTTSYTQIDAMLDKMLYEVEKEQEKLFSLDLDILEPDSPPCINSLELNPSTDALIEVPIKKSIRVPKVYQTTHEIKINDDNLFESVNFENGNRAAQENEYDLISFTEDVDRSNLSQYTNTDDRIEEARALINDVSDEDELQKLCKYEIQFDFAQRASSESLSEGYPEIMDDCADTFIDDDYETIEQRPLTYAYQLHDSRTGNDIWWEGTYRNLSIVPEEEEENLSLASENRSKMYFSKPCQNSEVLSQKLLRSFSSHDSSKSDTDTSSSFSSSSSEGHYETCEKVIKAEVKLLVKTSEGGKEAVEIRSVRDFIEPPEKIKRDSAEKNKCKTLPSKFSEKISSISSKFSNILDSSKKKSVSYSLLPTCSTNDDVNETKHSNKPTFTLQRLFIKNPDESNTQGNLVNSKELTKSRTELFATSNDNFPLKFDNKDSMSLDNKNEKFDLYENKPFYPCYNQYKPIQKNSSTVYVSPTLDDGNFPQAYCDWLTHRGDLSRGEGNSCSVLNSYAWSFAIGS